jgi:hypothetical protein
MLFASSSAAAMAVCCCFKAELSDWAVFQQLLYAKTKAVYTARRLMELGVCTPQNRCSNRWSEDRVGNLQEWRTLLLLTTKCAETS